jgi:quercetin dioxygenase-like cupin family protein
VVSIEKKNLNFPDQITKQLDKGKIETVVVSGVTLMRQTLQPGWKWSEHVKPEVNTDSCQKRHLAYIISGRLKVVMNDGKKVELVPGEFAVIEPGHDAWVVGDESTIMLEMAAIEHSH